MSEYANYIEQSAYEDGLEVGRKESAKRIKELERELQIEVATRHEMKQRIKELEAQLSYFTEGMSDDEYEEFQNELADILMFEGGEE